MAGLAIPDGAASRSKSRLELMETLYDRKNAYRLIAPKRSASQVFHVSSSLLLSLNILDQKSNLSPMVIDPVLLL